MGSYFDINLLDELLSQYDKLKTQNTALNKVHKTLLNDLWFLELRICLLVHNVNETLLSQSGSVTLEGNRSEKVKKITNKVMKKITKKNSCRVTTEAKPTELI